MKALLEQRATDAHAAMAIEMFTYQVRKSIGAFAAALGGVDTLVFTGGIGAHAAPVRAECCAGLERLGIRVDPARNAASAEVISAEEGACAVRVVRTDEELMIARHTRRLVFPSERVSKSNQDGAPSSPPVRRRRTVATQENPVTSHPCGRSPRETLEPWRAMSERALAGARGAPRRGGGRPCDEHRSARTHSQQVHCSSPWLPL
jgi:hypothetical protein